VIRDHCSAAALTCIKHFDSVFQLSTSSAFDTRQYSSRTMTASRHPAGFAIPTFDDQDDYCSGWTQGTDPIFGNRPDAQALRDALQPLQDFVHAADRYYPSPIAYTHHLMRYTPSAATAHYYRSNSRGPTCYDANGKAFGCHKPNCVPAFISFSLFGAVRVHDLTFRRHDQLKCSKAAARGHKSLLDRWDPKTWKVQSCLSCFVSTGTGCEFVKSGIHITYHDNIDSPATAGPDSPEPEETDLPKTPEQPKPAETVLPRTLKRDSENPLQTRSHKRPRNPPAIRTPTWATAPIPTRLLHFESLLHPLRALSYPPDLREPAGSPQVTRLSLLRRLPPLRWLPPSRWSPSLRRHLSSKLKRALRVPDLPRVTNGWLRSRRG